MEDRATVIEDQRVGFVGRWAQHPSHHLAIKTEALSRSRQNKAGCLGSVPSLAQHAAVADDVDAAGREALKDALPLLDRGRTIDVLSENAGAPEFISEVDRVSDVDRERDGSTTFA